MNIQRILSVAFLLTLIPLIDISQSMAQQHPMVLFGKYTVKRADKKNVWISMEKGDVEMKWEGLKPTVKEEFLKGYARQDSSQFALLQPHLATLHENPQATVDILIRIHRDFPESPYAGLWAGVAASAGLNDNERAKRLLNEARGRIEIQQILSPSVHQVTLSSVYNNLAICDLKMGNGNVAGGSFIKALDTYNVAAPVFTKNINQLLSVPDGAKASVERSMKQKLLKAAASTPVQAAGIELKDGWHYCLDFDVPENSAAAQKYAGIDAPAPGMTLHSIGTGIVLSKGFVITSRTNIEPSENHDRVAITVCYQTTSGWNSLRVTRAAVELSTVRADRFQLAMADGTNAVWTEIKVLPPAPGSSGDGLAALQVPGLPIKPAYVSTTPTRDLPVKYGYYLRTENLLEQGIQKVDSTMSRNIKSGRWTIPETIDGGARGAPIFDEDFGIVGLIYDYDTLNDTTVGGKVLTIDNIRNWFNKHAKTVQLTDMPASATDAEVNLNAAIVPVLTWIDRGEGRTLFSKVSDTSSPSGGIYMIDTWCLSCNGKGYRVCPACKGLGTQTQLTQQQAGFDPKIGTLMQKVPVVSRCPACNGNRHFDCTDCQKGRLLPH